MEENVKEKLINAVFNTAAGLLAEQKFNINKKKINKAREATENFWSLVKDLDPNSILIYEDHVEEGFKHLNKHWDTLETEVSIPRGGPKLHDELGCLLFFACEPIKNDSDSLDAVKNLIRQHGEIHGLFEKYKNDFLNAGYECGLDYEFIKLPACSAEDWHFNARKSLKSSAVRYLKQFEPFKNKNEQEVEGALGKLKFENILSQYEILHRFSGGQLRNYYQDILKLEPKVDSEAL